MTKTWTALKRLHDYIWRSPVETEHIRTYQLVWEGPFRTQQEEIDEARFWSRDEICESLGKGVLTPNLEEEIRMLGICCSPGK